MTSQKQLLRRIHSERELYFAIQKPSEKGQNGGNILSISNAVEVHIWIGRFIIITVATDEQLDQTASSKIEYLPSGPYGFQ